MSKLRLAIHGAAGRMGRRLVALGTADPELQIVAAWEAAQHPQLGTDAGLLAGVGPLNVPVSADTTTTADVVIDFSVPAGAEAITAVCADRGLPLVMATTTSLPITWRFKCASALSSPVSLCCQRLRAYGASCSSHSSKSL